MLAMIPNMCISFQAKFGAAFKEICRLMPKSRSLSRARPMQGHHAARPFSRIA
jgi:hypothetical protein